MTLLAELRDTEEWTLVNFELEIRIKNISVKTGVGVKAMYDDMKQEATYLEFTCRVVFHL